MCDAGCPPTSGQVKRRLVIFGILGACVMAMLVVEDRRQVRAMERRQLVETLAPVVSR
jgi:hypothetical protein